MCNSGHGRLKAVIPDNFLNNFLLKTMDEKLNSSILGTKDYWDEVYKGELKNYSDFLDVGEEWFGESVCKRIVKWVTQNMREDDNIIDIGCGNGKLLHDLSENGFKALFGIDYSENAIDLANSIIKNSSANIKFTVCNILEDSVEPIYNLALDKGTYDAISLDPDNAETKRAKYVQAVWDLLEEDGLFFIASCNWTEDELKKHFSSCFNYVKTLPSPSFAFGGHTGSTVTSIVFKKKQ
ncbi:UNVERIFIED_CONTAM: hypothetical protein PYX00_007477 [Menopon gallinae]|uniref:Protein-lysine N-methyltransferase PYX00_007477 n=1 Tax=Menopon gallinae TaxID=328185 RepID=A0AAW2HJA5_9NEOP